MGSVCSRWTRAKFFKKKPVVVVVVVGGWVGGWVVVVVVGGWVVVGGGGWWAPNENLMPPNPYRSIEESFSWTFQLATPPRSAVPQARMIRV